jgi:hypothetical protein
MTEHEKKVKAASAAALYVHIDIQYQIHLIQRHARFNISRDYLFPPLNRLEKKYIELSDIARELDPSVNLPVHVPRPAWDYDLK